MPLISEDFVFNGSLCVLENNMGLLFNNPDHSDTTFVVKDSTLYAWSGLVSVASPTLGSLISLQLSNCGNRDINLRKVKNVESFSMILKSIYGLSINFTQIKTDVLCEALTLADNFKLTNFFNGLKSYLSDIDNFSVETAVVLLNTAYKFKITNLYESVFLFACHNSNQIMKHESFPDLQYSVLVNLLKSNWFCSPEIDILTGILNWHTDMDKESKNVKYLVNVIGNHNVSDQAELCDNETKEELSECETNVLEKPDNSPDATEIVEKLEKANNVPNDKKVECFPNGNKTPSSASNSKNAEPTCSKKTNEGLAIVPVFSENILKSLLAHVRISKISVKEWMEALLTELFKNYNRLLLDINNFSLSHEPRREYVVVIVEPECPEYFVKNVKRTFTIKGLHSTSEQMYKSDIYFLSNLHTGIVMQFTDWNPGKNNSSHLNLVFTIFLICTSDEPENWECTTECQLKLISHKTGVGNIVLPLDNSYKTLTLNNTADCVEIGKWEWEGPTKNDWFETYKPNDIYTFELDFKSMRTKILK